MQAKPVRSVTRGGELLAVDVRRDLLFKCGEDDVGLDFAGLAVSVAAPDRLVVGLVRVGQADERHAGAVLPVESE